MYNNSIYSGKNLWEDPLKDEPSGLLLSDRISYYAQECKMVVPFDEKELRSLYYTLHIGDKYWIGREPHDIPDGGSVEIKPNGFVYIRVKELLNIPFYIVARYSLCVTLVYRGLMLDNGLQIDPGFRGNIHVPVYNFTDDTKYLKRDDPFLSIEFVRTSFSLNSVDLAEVKRPDDLYGATFRGVEGHPLKIFKKIRNRSLLEYFKPEDKNESSVLALRDRVTISLCDINKDIVEHKKATRRKVNTTNIIGGIGIGGVIIALFSIILTHFYWQEGKFSSLNGKYNTIKGGLVEEVRVQVEEDRITQLEITRNDISVINKSLGEMTTRQKISEDSTKALQEAVYQFEILLKQIKGETKVSGTNSSTDFFY